MKTQSILKSALCAAGLVAFALTGSAQAQVVNVDFNDATGTSDGSPTPSGTYSGVGAASDTGTVWNGFNVPSQALFNPTYTDSNLLNSQGTATGVSVTVSAPELINAGDYPGNPAATAPALMDDFIYSYSGSTDTLGFTIGGLNTGHTYNLYLYSEGAGYYSGGASFQIGATTLSAANNGSNPGGFVQGNNYVEFVGLTSDGLGNITGTVLTNNPATNNNANYFNGLQLVDTTPVVEAPEPSTVALMGLAGLAFLAIRRRHSLI